MTIVGVIIGRVYSPRDSHKCFALLRNTHGFFYTPYDISNPFFSQEYAHIWLRNFIRKHDVSKERAEHLASIIQNFPLPQKETRHDNEMQDVRILQNVIASLAPSPQPTPVGIYDVLYSLMRE